MNYRSSLARAKGLGSAKNGLHHWWVQRLTAVALIPLLLLLIIALAGLGQADYITMRYWLAQPWVAVLLILLLVSLYYHSALGMQVVIEDYVSNHWVRTTMIVFINFISILLGLVSVVSILMILFGATS